LLKTGFTSISGLGNGGAISLPVSKGPRFYTSGNGFVFKSGQFPLGTDSKILNLEYRMMNEKSYEAIGANKSGIIKRYADEEPNPHIVAAEILKKWVKRAHELGNVVAVHAILKDAIDRAIESKADSLEHGTQITTQQLEKRANEKIDWVPTVPFWPLIIY